MLQQVSRLLVDKNRHANATAIALATLKSGAVAEERKSIESGWACRALMGEAGERRNVKSLALLASQLYAATRGYRLSSRLMLITCPTLGMLLSKIEQNGQHIFFIKFREAMTRLLREKNSLPQLGAVVTNISVLSHVLEHTSQVERSDRKMGEALSVKDVVRMGILAHGVDIRESSDQVEGEDVEEVERIEEKRKEAGFPLMKCVEEFAYRGMYIKYIDGFVNNRPRFVDSWMVEAVQSVKDAGRKKTDGVKEFDRFFAEERLPYMFFPKDMLYVCGYKGEVFKVPGEASKRQKDLEPPLPQKNWSHNRFKSARISGPPRSRK